MALCRRHWLRGELAPLEVRKISAGKKRFLSLLLEADPSEAMIDEYLEDGELYALMVNGQTAAVAVMLQKDHEHCELMNLATAPEYRGQGYAGHLIRHLVKLYQPRCRRMEVGTDSSMVPFYERFGFRYAYTRENFFLDNYHPPIVENGVTLKDMQVLSMPL